MVSEDLSWSKHCTFIIAHAYKVLGLIRHTFSSSHCPSIGLKLYSQLLYCTQLQCPYLLKDIENIEQIQKCATISTSYRIIKATSYRTRLLKLNLLPLTYLFKLQDILFAIKSLKIHTKQFKITNYNLYFFQFCQDPATNSSFK